jgi:hypothetical protein
MRTIPDFADELKAIDPRLTVVPNPNRPTLCNIKLDGTDITPIPNYEIKEERDMGYYLELPNGTTIPHRSRPEALIMVRNVIELIKTKEGQDQFFGRNGY